MSKSIGIVGGMGPYATIDLFQKIVENTPAKTDQEHLRILIYNNPKIQPRSHVSEPNLVSPLPELIQSCLLLEQAGADFLIMPCHTAHIWYQDLKKEVSIPFISIIDNTVKTLLDQNRFYNCKMILFASETTIKNRLYQQAFANCPIELIIPVPEEQQVVDAVIRNVKAGKLTTNPYLIHLDRIIEAYQEKGVDVFLAGCTEIPLITPYLKVKPIFIDTTLMLATTAIRYASQTIHTGG